MRVGKPANSLYFLPHQTNFRSEEGMSKDTREYKRGDEVFLNLKTGLVPGTILRFSFYGPLDGEPYYEVKTADEIEHYPVSAIIPKGEKQNVEHAI
jgi:hypothetical protein